MTESLATAEDERVPEFDLIWQDRLAALASGQCSEDDFMDELCSLDQSSHDQAWNVVALLDQQFRRGRMPVDLFRSVEEKIARRQIGAPSSGITIDLLPPTPAAASSAPKPALEAAAKPVPTAAQVVAQALAAAKPTAAQARMITARLDDLPPSYAPTAVPAAAAQATQLPPPVLTNQMAPRKLADANASIRLRRVDIGTTLRERYQIEACLGKGGMGTVFKAVDRFRREHGAIGSYVALKVLHEQTRERPDVLDKLRREFYCAQALSHRSVVKVFELDHDGDFDFFTMELLEGELLAKVMEQFGQRPLPRPAAWAIIREVGAGIAHAHDRKVIHADLKPQNIMLTNNGGVRILDFGASSDAARDAARNALSADPRNKSVSVTPAYASCEMLERKSADPRDDLFALACLSYELLAGEHPFQHKRATEARSARMVAKRPEGISSRQWRTLQQGMAWDRHDRSISVRDWMRALKPGKTALSGIPRPQEKAATTGAGQGAISMQRKMIAAAALVLIALATWAVLRKPHRIVPEVESVALSPQPAAPSAAPDVVDSAGADNADAADDAAAQPAAEAAPAAEHKEVRKARPIPNLIGMATPVYRIQAGVKFAEIHVIRAAPTHERASFVWWTEDASALAGIDYVAQGQTTAYFAPGSHEATLFIKLLMNAPRKQAKFNVMIGEVSAGASLGAAKSAVLLSASHP